MTKRTYAVHYGNGHLARCQTLPRNFRSLATAKHAAKSLINKYGIVIIADTDGNEWDLSR
jgi:hypothetical protein